LSDRRASGSAWPVILLLLGMTGIAAFFSYVQLASRERDAMERIKQLGALCSMASNKRHLNSVNLSTITDREKFREAIALIEDLPWLNSIDLSNSILSDANLKVVSGAPNVKSLMCNQTAISDEGAAWLSAMRSLESLHLGGTKISETSLPAISRLKRLRILNLSSTNIRGGLEPLSELPLLDWLLLRDLTIEDESLATIVQIEHLNRLNIIGTHSDNADTIEAAPGMRIER